MVQEAISPSSQFGSGHDFSESGFLTPDEVLNDHAVTVIPKEKTLVLKPFVIQHNDCHFRTLIMRPAVVEVSMYPKSLVVSYPPSTGIFLLGREGEPLTAEAICVDQIVTMFGNQSKDSNLFVAKVILIHTDKINWVVQ